MLLISMRQSRYLFTIDFTIGYEEETPFNYTLTTIGFGLSDGSHTHTYTHTLDKRN